MKKILTILLGVSFTFSQVFAIQAFVDIGPEHWAFPYVQDILAQGIIDDGYYFHPDRYLSRAELVKMMVTTTTGVLDDQLPESQSFPDVAPSDWFYPYVETAKITGIIDGYADGFFRPDRQVVRAEAVKVVINSLGIQKSVDPQVVFRDYNSSAWFHIYVATAFNQGIIQGRLNDRGVKQMIFEPSSPVTRAEMAKMISKTLAVSVVY